MKIKLLMVCVFTFSFAEHIYAMSANNTPDKTSVDAAITLIKFRNGNSATERSTKNQLIPTYNKEKIIKAAVDKLFCAFVKKDPLAIILTNMCKKEELIDLLNQNLPNELSFSSALHTQLKENLQKKYLTSLKNSLLLSKTELKLRKEMTNLRKYRDISENNVRRIRNKRIDTYDKINETLISLSNARNQSYPLNIYEMINRYNRMNEIFISLSNAKSELYRLNIHEMSEFKVIGDLTQRLRIEGGKLQEVRNISKKIRREKHNNFILLEVYKNLDNLSESNN